MKSWNRTVGVVVNDLQPKLSAGIVKRKDVNQHIVRVAQAVVAALRDESHPLSELLQQFRKFVNTSQLNDAAPTAQTSSVSRRLTPELWYFSPTPGISSARFRTFWPLQFLLLYAAHALHTRSDLAAAIGLPPKILDDACKAWEDGTICIGRAPHEVAHRLITALNTLNVAESYVLRGRTLSNGVETTRLSAKQTMFLDALISDIGRPVTVSQLRDKGIQDPTNLKYKLCVKLETNGMSDLNIESRDGSYLLHTEIRRGDASLASGVGQTKRKRKI